MSRWVDLKKTQLFPTPSSSREYVVDLVVHNVVGFSIFLRSTRRGLYVIQKTNNF